jgi:rRNA pseudouridine-1189 N-methylase Emg1 (Nep1/Mra1 family)
MIDLSRLLLMPRSAESFEELISQFMARAKQTTPGETLRHLRKQKIKEIVAE